MYYTVSDFARTHEANLTLVAGGGGMARAVREVGMLDYELMPGVKASYQRKNFYADQLVLTTFLYAKDDPYLILDAVKYLVAQGVSALVVKNVLHLAIPEAAVRYANARNFPLFTTRGEFMFDHVVAQVGDAVKRMENAVLVEQEVDALLQADSAEERQRRAHGLNPSLRGVVAALYTPFDDEVMAGDFAEYEARFERSSLFGAGSALMCYRNGLLLLVSGDSEDGIDLKGRAGLLRADVLLMEQTAPVGASSLHYGAADAAEAVREALCCARIARMRGVPTVFHGDLGVLQALLPHAASSQMAAFAERILGPLREFDAENNGQLIATLQAYCDAGHNIAETARVLGQHPNTIRYRLEKAHGETGLSYKVPADMEQLSLACKIDFSRRVLDGL